MQVIATQVSTVSLQLQLTLEDVDWLRALVQNPSHKGESAEDTGRRQQIFVALQNIIPIALAK